MCHPVGNDKSGNNWISLPIIRGGAAEKPPFRLPFTTSLKLWDWLFSAVGPNVNWLVRIGITWLQASHDVKEIPSGRLRWMASLRS